MDMFFTLLLFISSLLSVALFGIIVHLVYARPGKEPDRNFIIFHSEDLVEHRKASNM